MILHIVEKDKEVYYDCYSICVKRPDDEHESTLIEIDSTDAAHRHFGFTKNRREEQKTVVDLLTTTGVRIRRII